MPTSSALILSDLTDPLQTTHSLSPRNFDSVVPVSCIGGAAGSFAWTVPVTSNVPTNFSSTFRSGPGVDFFTASGCWPNPRIARTNTTVRLVTYLIVRSLLGCAGEGGRRPGGRTRLRGRAVQLRNA